MILLSLGFLQVSPMDLVDIIVVAILIYMSFRWLKGSSAINLFIGIAMILGLRIAAVVLDMKMLSTILGSLIDIGALALVIIFQPEIRRFLSKIGRGTGENSTKLSLFDRMLGRREDEIGADTASIIAQACVEMAESKTGALIVLTRKGSLRDIIDTGDNVDATIGVRLIETIFFKNSPLHDGAMVISGGRIVAARCTLPISDRTDIPARYGMRHKAGIGITERSDAEAIVVSEQTGKISYIKDGAITPVKGRRELELLLSAPDPQKEEAE